MDESASVTNFALSSLRDGRDFFANRTDFGLSILQDIADDFETEEEKAQWLALSQDVREK